jgi:hypothetical protein
MAKESIVGLLAKELGYKDPKELKQRIGSGSTLKARLESGGGIGESLAETAKSKIEDIKETFSSKGLKRFGKKMAMRAFSDDDLFSAYMRGRFAKKVENVDSMKDVIGDKKNLEDIKQESVGSDNVLLEILTKNSMTLPVIARDMNVMRQNIQELVKVMGGEKKLGADMYFKTADEYEKSLESERGKRTGKSGTKTQKVQELAKEKGESVSNFLSFFNQQKLVTTLAPIAKGLASVLLSPAFLASIGLGGLAFLFYKMFSSKGAFSDETSETAKGLKQAEKVGGLAGVKDAEEKRKKLNAEDRAYLEVTELERYTENGVVNDAMLKDIAKKSPEHAAAVKKYRIQKNVPEEITPPKPTKSDFQKTDKDTTPVVAPTKSDFQKTDKDTTPVAEPMTLPASKLRPTPTSSTTGTEIIPSNVVRSSSGEPVRTGTGGFVTSGEPTESTSPTKVESASIPSASGLPIDYKSYVEKIGEKESGGNYKAVNTLGYLGKYQFGAMALQDMGLVKKGTSLKGLDDPENWNIEGGKQAFLNNSQLQEDTMLHYTKQNFKTLNRIGVINKDSSPQEIAGYLAASHLLGPGGAKELSKGKVGADAYGTSSATYFKVGSATQGGQGSGIGTSVALAPSIPTSGSTVSSASSSVAEGQRQAMIPSSGSSTVIDNSSKTVVTSSSKGGKSASAYDTDLIRTLIGAAA